MKIDKTRTSISSTPMVLKEGIIANNDILNYNEFYDFMKQMLNEEVLNSFSRMIEGIKSDISGNRKKDAYLKWEALEREILGNNGYAVSLMFIENIDSNNSTDYNFKYHSQEHEILSRGGRLTSISKLIENYYNDDKVSDQIGNHLKEFLDDIETKEVRWKFIQMLFHEDDSDIKERASNARWYTKNWTYQNILYGKDNPSWQGNAADAFMNHMAHLHVQVMANKISDINDKTLFAQSVFNEERDNLWPLLIASKNNTPWFTGGDIVFKYQGELFNIQLKTGKVSVNRSRIGGKLSTFQLNKMLTELEEEVKNKNIDNIIQKLFNELKTSGYVEATDKFLAKEIDNLVDNIKKI